MRWHGWSSGSGWDGQQGCCSVTPFGLSHSSGRPRNKTGSLPSQSLQSAGETLVSFGQWFPLQGSWQLLPEEPGWEVAAGARTAT